MHSQRAHWALVCVSPGVGGGFTCWDSRACRGPRGADTPSQKGMAGVREGGFFHVANPHTAFSVSACGCVALLTIPQRGTIIIQLQGQKLQPPRSGTKPCLCRTHPQSTSPGSRAGDS